MVQCIVDKRPKNCSNSIQTIDMDANVRIIKEDGTGILWIGAGNTLKKMAANGNILWSRDLPEAAKDVEVDSDGLIWVASGKKVYRYSGDGNRRKTLTLDQPVRVLANDPLA